MPPDLRLLLAVLAPLLGAGFVMAAGRRPNLREACSLVAAVTLLLLVASLVPAVRAGHLLHFTVFSLLPGLSVSLRGDPLSMIFALTASFLWVVTVFYSAGYMRSLGEHAQTRFNTCFALAIFGAIGCAFSDNLLTLYLFYEIVSVCTYPLVAHHQDEEGYEGGKRYLLYLTTAAKGLVLPAMALIYVLSGTLDFATGVQPGILPAGVHDGVIVALYICCILGFAKNAIMPLHHWLPGAMVAPAPVSALLHAVAVVKVGAQGPVYPLNVEIKHSPDTGIGTLTWSANPVGRPPAKYRVYGSDEKGFTVHDAPYEVRLGDTKALANPFPANFVAEVAGTSLDVVGVGNALPNANRAYYRVVAVDSSDKRSGDSDYVEAPRPFIYSAPLTDAPAGQPYSYQVKAIRSLGDLARRDGAKPKPGTRFWKIEPLEFALTQKPNWMSINADTGLVTGTSDGTGGTVIVSVTLTKEHRLVHDKDAIVWGNEYEQSKTLETLGPVTQQFVVNGTKDK